jgi:hypothetical protein
MGKILELDFSQRSKDLLALKKAEGLREKRREERREHRIRWAVEFSQKREVNRCRMHTWKS